MHRYVRPAFGPGCEGEGTGKPGTKHTEHAYCMFFLVLGKVPVWGMGAVSSYFEGEDKLKTD